MKSFEPGGGKVLQKLRPPLNDPDFAPFLQRARDASAEASVGTVSYTMSRLRLSRRSKIPTD
jgi:hypothetical protein